MSWDLDVYQALPAAYHRGPGAPAAAVGIVGLTIWLAARDTIADTIAGLIILVD